MLEKHFRKIEGESSSSDEETEPELEDDETEPEQEDRNYEVVL